MPKLILTILCAVLFYSGTATAWAAQLSATIYPDRESSPFEMTYQNTVYIEHPNGGDLYEELYGKDWIIYGDADGSDPGVQDLIDKLNQKIATDGSRARIADMFVYYIFHLTSSDTSTVIAHTIGISGNLTDYIIARDPQRTIVDMGWRGLSTDDNIVIDGFRVDFPTSCFPYGCDLPEGAAIGGVEINHPISVIRMQEPEAAALLAGTEVEALLSKNLIDVDGIARTPLEIWHFLFEPLGCDARERECYDFDEGYADSAISMWSVGKIIRPAPVDVFEAEIEVNQIYTIKSVQELDRGRVLTVGLGAAGVSDGVETFCTVPVPPEPEVYNSDGFAEDAMAICDEPLSPERHPIIYAIAGAAVVTGVALLAGGALRRRAA